MPALESFREEIGLDLLSIRLAGGRSLWVVEKLYEKVRSARRSWPTCVPWSKRS